jgi:hypothetical protein
MKRISGSPYAIFGRLLFTAGAERPVYEDVEGRPTAVDDDAQRFQSVWPPAQDKSVVRHPVGF